MARRRLPFSVVKRPGSPFWYYKLGEWKSYKSTGKKLKSDAIKRADILGYRERLIEKLGYTRTVQKAVSVVKTILKEAYFREDLNRDPTSGIGITKYQATEIGTFSEKELQKLFPPEPPGPWQDIYDYAVFLTAAAMQAVASTGRQEASVRIRSGTR